MSQPPPEKTIFRRLKREAHFTIIDNELLRDKTLSFKARGLLAMLLSHVDTWEVHQGWIQEQGTEGREAIRGAFQELERAGYISYSEPPRVAGKFTQGVWNIHEEALPVNAKTNRTRWREEILKTSEPSPPDHEREAVNGSPVTANRERETVNGLSPAKNTIGRTPSEEDHQRNPPVPPAEPRPSGSLEGDLLDGQNEGGPVHERLAAKASSPLQIRVGAIKGRRESTPWSPKELKAWKVVAKTLTEADLALVETYYAAPHPPDKDYRRRDLLTLLNNWPGEVDRARAFIPTPTPKEDGTRHKFKPAF